MLSLDDIQQAASQRKLPEASVEKDYVLDWLLWGIAQQDSLSSALAFKGGTCLHKMYFEDWRFSEDLDFTTVAPLIPSALAADLSAICRMIQRQAGLSIAVREIEPHGPKGNPYTFQANLEYVGPRRQTGGPLPTVKIDITDHELLMDAPVSLGLIDPFPGVPSGWQLRVYSLEEVIAEKLRTVAYQRCWPRDIYDLWRLLRTSARILNANRIVSFFERKCVFRGFAGAWPENWKDRLLSRKPDWVQTLKPLLGDPPDFDDMLTDLQKEIVKLFPEPDRRPIMLDREYVLKYRKGDFEVEVHGDKEFAETKFAELMRKESPSAPHAKTAEAVPGVSHPQTPASPSTTKSQSIAEFAKAHPGSTHNDKILVFGYFLEKEKEYNSFNLDDIRECYQQAKTPQTKNFSPYVSGLISSGYLMDAPEKKDSRKAWVLTQSGESYVEALRASS